MMRWTIQKLAVEIRSSSDIGEVACQSHLNDSSPQVGDQLELLGPNQSVDQLAVSCGTIGYEILTSLGKRYRRTYIGQHG